MLDRNKNVADGFFFSHCRHTCTCILFMTADAHFSEFFRKIVPSLSFHYDIARPSQQQLSSCSSLCLKHAVRVLLHVLAYTVRCTCVALTSLQSVVWQLASCLINAQPLPPHRRTVDDNSLIGCTGHDLTDDWSPASAHFVDSLCPFWCLFGCVFSLNQMFWKQCTVRQYQSDLSDKSALEIGLGFRLDSELHYFSIFHGE